MISSSFCRCFLGKCRGLRTARKLRSHRRDQKWHDKQYKKAHLGTALKANPFGGASHAKGIVLEKVWVKLPGACLYSLAGSGGSLPWDGGSLCLCRVRGM